MPQQANNSDLYEDAPVCGLQFGHFTKLVGTGYFFSLFTGGNWFQLPLGINIWLDQKNLHQFSYGGFLPIMLGA